MAAPTQSKNFSSLTALEAAPAAADELFIFDASEGTAVDKPKRITFTNLKTNLTYPGGTDVAVADGGTGASDTANARINLELNYPVTESTATPFNVNDLAYAFTTQRITLGTSVSVVISSNAITPYPVGTEVYFIQGGAGEITFSISTDTLNWNVNLTAVTNGQYAVAGIKKVTTTEWILFGNLVPA